MRPFRPLLCILLVALSSAGTALCAQVMTGIDVLAERGFPGLGNKRVGLLTHPAGVNRYGESTVAILNRARTVNLVALFGPEHGIYGDEKASQPVDDRIDTKTGLPVYSLYGKYRRPSAEMLAKIDVMVIDLQDIGVRSYTYTSCMRYTMERCFEYGVEVMVLDRPNPLGGLKVDGPPLDRRWRSYVGAFHVPYVHGLTIGELARISKSVPGWLEIPDNIREKGQLTVIPMKGWRRSMRWPETGLRWVPTSPNIPTLSAVLGYAMTGLGAQEGGFSHGIGTPYPFRLLRYKGVSNATLERALNARNIPGVRFKPVRTQTDAGVPIEGLYVIVDDWQRLRPTELSFHMMQISAAWESTNPFVAASNPDLFNKHVGSSAWWTELTTRGEHARVPEFVRHWEEKAEAFQRASKRYWLYGD